MKAAAVPVEMSWMWTLAFGHHEDRSRRTATRRRARPQWRRSPKAGGGVAPMTNHHGEPPPLVLKASRSVVRAAIR
jgi:hypothetical protein